jgi:hypothetical protein
MRTIFHADLSDAHPGEEYWLHAFGKRHSLVPHTEESRALARVAAPHLTAVPDENLTHYTAEAVELPADQVVRVHLKNSLNTFPDAKGVHGVSHVAIHIPPPADQLETMAEAGAAHHQSINYVSTAKALVFHHADLINNDPNITQVIYDYMDNDKIISSMFENLAQTMRQMGPPAENSGWALLVPYTPPANPDNTAPGAAAAFDGKKTYYTHEPTDQVQTAAGPVMTAMMKATKNDVRLKDKKWFQQTGASVTPANPPASTENAPQVREGMPPVARVAVSATDTGDAWNVALANTDYVHGLQTSISVLDPSNRKVKLSLSNQYIRYLAAYIRFFDSDQNALNLPNWMPDDAGLIDEIVKAVDIQYDDLRFLGTISPRNNVFAVPIPPDGTLDVDITFPDNAVSATVYGAGLGTGADFWPKTPIIGGVMTALCNLTIPAFMLAFGAAAQSYKPLYDLLGDPKVIAGLIVVGIAFYGAEFGTSAAEHKMNWSAFTSLLKILFDKAATKALVWVEGELAADEVADEIPFAGWIVLAMNIATGVAQMAETIVQVATSPWNIENNVALSITTKVTLHPDPRNTAFPQGKDAHYTVKMIYKDQTRATVTDGHDVAAGSTALTLDATFPNNTLGGQVKFEADYYVGSWLAGKATTGWIENDETHVAQVDLFLVEFPFPLTDKSIYQHSQLLSYQNGAYIWQTTADAPTATIADRDTSNSGNAISDWAGITLSQKRGMIGFAWKAAGMGITSCDSGQGGQLYAMQNINIPGTPMDAVKFPGCGFDGQTQLVYDPYPPKFKMDANGQWVIGPDKKPVPDLSDTQLGDYYIDPRKSAISLTNDGGYHLRKVTLDDSTPFDQGNNLLSWGRFAYFPDSFALHPSGHIIAVSSKFNKIQVAQLAAEGAQDSDVPVARSYAGEAFNADRPGLLFHPLAVTCTYDGTILILEDTKSSTGGSANQIVARIQAFDIQGNPVNRFFDDTGNPSPFLQLSNAANFDYLDIAAVGDEKLTYIYVLYYTGNGSSPGDYHLAIYQYSNQPPAKNPLVITDSVAAARIAVDMWHTAYTLNFGMVTDGQGQPAGPQVGNGSGVRTVPSVSEWLPPTT